MIEIEYVEPTLLDSIRVIAERYTKRNQWKKAIEETKELLDELEAAENPNESEDVVVLPGNTWSEAADQLVVLIELMMQHRTAEVVRNAVTYKVSRQLERMLNEGLITAEEYKKYRPSK